MRALSAAQQGVVNAGRQGEWVRVQVKDPGGTFRDLTTYPGVNLFDSATWRANLDEPLAVADIRLKREVEKLSLAPLITDSALNHAFNPASAYAPLLDYNREIKIETAIVPMDQKPASGDWFPAFHGRIDTIDSAANELVVVSARDLGGQVQDAFIEQERVYSLATVSSLSVPLRVWEPNTPYVVGDYILPATRGAATASKAADPGNGRFFKCTTAGTSGLTEPVWPGSSTIADGTCVHTYQGVPANTGNPVEQVIQNILDDTLGSGVVALFVVGSPGWNIKQFIQRREPVLDAIRTLAAQIGWDIRYKWDSGTSAFRLTLYQPTRTSPTVDQTFSKSQYVSLRKFAGDRQRIRNVVKVIYPDASDTYPDGQYRRKALFGSNAGQAASITKYGRLFMEISEDTMSQVDSATEAQKMADACLADLLEPNVEAEVAMSLAWPFAELNDYYTFSANGRHFNADQSLAVFGWEQTAGDGKLRTTLRLRGKPSIGARVWGNKAAHPKGQPHHSKSLFQDSATPSATASTMVGGALISTGNSLDKNAQLDEYEHHVYPTSGTALSSSTLQTISRDRNIALGHLTPGKMYYGKTVPRAWNGRRLIRGEPSGEYSFVAGWVEPRYLNPQTVVGSMPPNGSFEGQIDSSTVPDLWNMVTGTFGPGGDAGNASADSYDGSVAVELRNTAVASKIRSSFFPVTAGYRYMLEAFIKKVGTPTATADIAIEWYDRAQSIIGTADVLGTALSGLGSGWTRVGMYKNAPSTAAYAKVYVAKHDNTAFAFYVDAIRLVPQDRVLARYKSSAGNTVTNNAFTLIDFATSDYDTHSAVTTGASWKFTVPTGKAGKYFINFGLLIDFTTFNGQTLREARIYKNGSPLTEVYRDNSTSTGFQGAYGSTVLDLAEGDYIDLRYQQSCGANKALYNDGNYNWIAITRLDPA